jgi:hypothetical protein
MNLILLFRKYRFVRKIVGGRWLKKKEAGYSWLQFNGSNMEAYGMVWPNSFPHEKFELEDW